MKVAYIAGPYKATSEWAVWMNIQRASEVALKYWKLGCAVICPHRNTAFFGGACEDRIWLDGDLEIMRRCDVVVMIPEWERSSGARREHEVALALGKEVVYEGCPEEPSDLTRIHRERALVTSVAAREAC